MKIGCNKNLKDNDGNTLQFSKMNIMRFDKSKSSSFSVKYSYDQGEFLEVEVRGTRQREHVCLHKPYSKPFPFSERKKRDCLSLLT